MALHRHLVPNQDVPMDPATDRTRPWPLVVILAIIAAGLISPFFCFIGAALAYALADQDQGLVLTGAGLVHLVFSLTFFAGA